MSKMSELHTFIGAVESILESNYNIKDGGDLCFNLIEQGVVKMDDGVARAAQIVAQHIEQA